MTSPAHLTCAAAALLATLGACSPAPTATGAAGDPGVSRLRQEAPPGAAPGTCWDRSVSPAVIETVTHQVLVRPARTDTGGKVIAPAVYRTETSQQIVQDRRETWFQALCETDLTEEFVASLQRALAARGLYGGAITGTVDAATRKAVRRYQKPTGPDSATLSLDAARRLGLIAVDLDKAG